jgi:hypothetical protein
MTTADFDPSVWHRSESIAARDALAAFTRKVSLAATSVRMTRTSEPELSITWRARTSTADAARATGFLVTDVSRFRAVVHASPTSRLHLVAGAVPSEVVARAFGCALVDHAAAGVNAPAGSSAAAFARQAGLRPGETPVDDDAGWRDLAAESLQELRLSVDSALRHGPFGSDLPAPSAAGELLTRLLLDTGSWARAVGDDDRIDLSASAYIALEMPELAGSAVRLAADVPGTPARILLPPPVHPELPSTRTR